MNTIEYKDNTQAVSLPKWPAFTVVGDRVTSAQAAEICIKTDSFVPNFKYASNDRSFERELNALFGVPYDNEENARETWKRHDELRDRLGVLNLGYLNNARIVSSFIGGPHGWCDWDGNIFCNSFNIGKWPDVEDVATDWATIAAAFPFLTLRSQVFSGETSESDSQPVVEFSVSDGRVIVQSPTTADHVNNSVTENIINMFSNPNRERGITIKMLERKLKDVYGEIPQW